MRTIITLLVVLALAGAAGAASSVDWSSSSTWTDEDRTAALWELKLENSELNERVAVLELGVQAQNAALRRAIRHLARCVRKDEAAENACTDYYFSGGFAP